MAFCAKMLRETFSPLGRLIDLAGDVRFRGCGLFKVVEVESELVVRAAFPFNLPLRVQKQCMRDGIDDALGVLREGYIDASRAFDLTYLTQQHIKHNSINRVVRAVKQAGLYLRGFLSEAMPHILALFQPVGIPREVVVEYGREEVCRLIPSLRQSVATRTRALAPAISAIRSLRSSSRGPHS